MNIIITGKILVKIRKKLTAANIDKNAVIENVIETLQKSWESEEKTRDRKLRNNFMNASRI